MYACGTYSNLADMTRNRNIQLYSLGLIAQNIYYAKRTCDLNEHMHVSGNLQRRRRCYYRWAAFPSSTWCGGREVATGQSSISLKRQDNLLAHIRISHLHWVLFVHPRTFFHDGGIDFLHFFNFFLNKTVMEFCFNVSPLFFRHESAHTKKCCCHDCCHDHVLVNFSTSPCYYKYVIYVHGLLLAPPSACSGGAIVVGIVLLCCNCGLQSFVFLIAPAYYVLSMSNF